jgi:hypothetical protein
VVRICSKERENIIQSRISPSNVMKIAVTVTLTVIFQKRAITVTMFRLFGNGTIPDLSNREGNDARVLSQNDSD